METTLHTDDQLQASNGKVQGILNFISEPGAVTIEAIADVEGESQEKPRLPRFSMLAYTGGPMRIAGWRYPVIVDLAGLAIPSQNRPIRFGHDMQSGVGHTDAIKVETDNLRQLVLSHVIHQQQRKSSFLPETVFPGKRRSAVASMNLSLSRKTKKF